MTRIKEITLISCPSGPKCEIQHIGPSNSIQGGWAGSREISSITSMMASPPLHHRKLQGSQNNILHEFKKVQNDVILNEQLTLG